MINRKMYMTQTCAGYAGEYGGDGKKGRLWWVQWLISELILLTLLVAAGAAWLEYRAQYGKNYAVPSIPRAVAEQPVSEEAPSPLNMRTEMWYKTAGISADAGQKDAYYAGPVGNRIKEPEEIRVVIDPGHGGIDEGCARGGVREKEVNLSIALRVRERLEKLGYQVIMTRDTDESLSLGERIQTAEESHADIFVSIHQNSSNLRGVNGLEIYYSAQNAGTDSERLAGLIHQDALQSSGAKARSVFAWEKIRVIRESEMPACLIETGFLTNASERSRLADPAYQERLAEGIVSGIDRYFRPKTLYLTCDAGTSERSTEKMLSLLKAQNIKATFFVTGETAVQEPELLERVTEAGHDIGIYENRGAYKGVYADTDRYLAALADTFGKIARVTGETPILFHAEEDAVGRTGEISADLLENLKEYGFVPYEWEPGL